MISLLFDDPIKNLYISIENCEYVDCEIQLKDGVDPNSEYNDKTLLFWIFAFYEKEENKKRRQTYIDIIELFLRYGANIDKIVEFEISKDILRKAKTSFTTVFTTLLSVFCIIGNTELVKLILKYNPNINYKDNRKFTPLIYAANFGNASVVKELMKHKGIDILTTDNNDYTASDYARLSEHKNIYKYLSGELTTKIDSILSRDMGKRKKKRSKK